MALSAGGRIADDLYREFLRLEAETLVASQKFWECSAAVERGEMTCDLQWSPEGDLSYIFKPVQES